MVNWDFVVGEELLIADSDDVSPLYRGLFAVVTGFSRGSYGSTIYDNSRIEMTVVLPSGQKQKVNCDYDYRRVLVKLDKVSEVSESDLLKVLDL